MTKPHDDRIKVSGQDHGYSIRVGKKLPPNSVNLAYVYTPEMEPKKNLLITDMSTEIVENSLAEVENQQALVYPDDTFLLREINKPFVSSTKNILLTDEFSVPETSQEFPLPLYYKAELKGWFDAKGSSVAYYANGYVEDISEEAFAYSAIDPTKANMDLLYLGSKIRITNLDGTPISQDKKYKVQLVKQTGAGIPANAYRVILYTNFRGDSQVTYAVHYERYNADSSHVSDYVEILNAYPFFTEMDKDALDDIAQAPKVGGEWRTELKGKNYAITKDGQQMWQVYAPSQVIIADNKTRPAHQFKYRVRGKLRTKFNTEDNQGSLNIGIVYLNQSIFMAEELTSVLKKVYEHGLKPPYLEFVNPHHPFNTTYMTQEEKTDLKHNPSYWSVDITMPADYLNDYDLIIVTGYGAYDMSPYSDALRNYLQNGGRLWIDNAGSGSNVLKLDNFLINIGFSGTINSTGTKAYGIPDAQLSSHDPYSIERQAVERLYLISKTDMQLGYGGINPQITFGVGEDLSLWTQIVRYTNNDPSVITRSIYGTGQLIVSNCGIFRSLANRESDDIKLSINTILSIAENKSVTTPWMQEFVYHRDNLFKEEYKNGDSDAYVDDRSDVDSTQIVAKKILAKTMRDALLPYIPSSYYKAKGTFTIDVEADTNIVVLNNDFEVGTFDSTTNSAITNWTATIVDAIHGWSTKTTSGSLTYEHVSSISQRGQKAVKITASNMAKGFWYSSLPQVTAGTYKATVWMKTVNVVGTGAVIAVYKADGTLIAVGEAVTGTRDWVKIEVNFPITVTTDIELRLGFFEDNTKGIVYIDYVNIVSLGSVLMTPENNGERSLYAYAIKPRSDSFNLKAQGFSSADITVYDPEIEFNYTIRSFVYMWDNDLVQYVRQYGNYKTYSARIRRSSGTVNLGLLTTLLPGLNGGSAWADRNKVFYEIIIGDNQNSAVESNFVNAAFFNTKSGSYFFTKDGQNVLGYTELFDNGSNQLGVIVQAWTDYYTIRATKRRYAVRPMGNEKIYLEYPSTIDNRDSWFVRVHNGTFVKTSLSYKEQGIAGDFYKDRRYGTHKYEFPEYERQLFKPSRPFRRVRKEICEYINESTVKVQNAPLYVKTAQVRGELMTNLDGYVFRANSGDWVTDSVPKVYRDSGFGMFVEVMDGFDIDLVNGLIIFEETQTAAIKVDYNINNLEIYKRSYNNAKLKKEALVTSDKKIFVAKNKNWMLYPCPVIYRIPYGQEDDKLFIAPVETYEIDYDGGTVRFKEEVNDRVFSDYNYSTDIMLQVRDYDVQSGLIYLSTDIQFKDELYANYYYEEHFVEYRGYFDEAVGQYIHLDLNPAEGHYCTLPVVYSFPKETRYEQVPTAKLMNKEVYIYMLPHQSSLGDVNDYTIRHCYSKAEWDKINSCMPGIALLLGVAQLREHAQVTDAVVLDTRLRGGGLKQSITRKTIKERDPNTTSFWDVGPWDGMAYYRNGVVIIKIPSSILESRGGQFTEKQVTDIVRKYIAYGIYYMIEYVDDSEFTTVNGDMATIYIQGASFPMTTEEV